MTNDPKNSNVPKQKFDLEERTARYAERIVDFSRKLPNDLISKPLISQIIRSGTSIGANYSEADEASSKKDFINKVNIAKKETKETKYWLRIISHALPQFQEEARGLWKEAQELNLILAAIVRNSKNKI
jgi:four helix bundle protein